MNNWNTESAEKLRNSGYPQNGRGYQNNQMPPQNLQLCQNGMKPKNNFKNNQIITNETYDLEHHNRMKTLNVNNQIM